MATDVPVLSDSKMKTKDVSTGTATDLPSEVDEKKLMRKLDGHIIPLVMLLCQLPIIFTLNWVSKNSFEVL